MSRRHRRGSRSSAVAVPLLTVLVLAGPLAAGAAASTSTRLRAASAPRYLLALGDSLAAGYQPSNGTVPPPADPSTGYPDQGYPVGYAADLASTRHLTLVDLACPGETTASMTGQSANGQCTKTYEGEFGAASQLQAATAYLARHRRRVALVTLDLGADDVDGCVSGHGVDVICLEAGYTAVEQQLPAIVASLRAAIVTDDPGTHLVAMNYYDPFLGAVYAPGGTTGTTVAALSLTAATSFNDVLAAIYHRHGTLLADVASAFKSGESRPVRSYAGHRLPLDVDLVCRWTWMCPLPGSSVKADIHVDASGYAVIARAFNKALSPT